MSEKIDVKGVVETILDIQEFASGFKKQTLVIDTGGKFPQMVAIDFAKEKIELLANIVEGQEVTVGVNIRGNEYNGKYYVSLAGWKLDAGANGTTGNDLDDVPF
jgi:hypothetical protein